MKENTKEIKYNQIIEPSNFQQYYDKLNKIII